ncbi:MAG TPA: ricin-type beta-trefoil lectin domain protein [Streptosporangiaceae bacterium]|nr:ricin-type beta-trefoil lectin domain protein [Streptosporangiaceae bacterium]
MTTAKASATKAGRTASAAASTSPSGLTPAQLQATYGVQSAPGSGGSPSIPGLLGQGQTVAIVGAGAYPTAASDLATYRSQYGIPPCTVADGCLKIEDENGGDSLPTQSVGNWSDEYAMDLDIVSAICENCHILLIEAATDSITDLGTGTNTAADTAGVTVVDNSYYGPEFSNEVSDDSLYFTHPGVAIVAAAGDTGYTGEINYPAASPDVVSVGGTVLTQNSSGTWIDTSAWSQTASGCSEFEAKPAWQTDTGCAGRTDNDISAVAATESSGVVDDTPIAFYNSAGGDWLDGGGTGAAADVVSGLYADAGTPAAGTNPAEYPYEYPGGSYTTPGNAYPYYSGLNDIADGSTNAPGGCAATYLCTTGAGYDGPTGLGAPVGTSSLAASGSETGAMGFGSWPFYCLTNEDQDLTNNNPIQIFWCDGKTNSQKWNVNSNGTITVGNNSGYCMETKAGGTANGTDVVLYACNGFTRQQWRMMSNGEIVGEVSGKCLDSQEIQPSNALVIEPCTDSDLQQWTTPYSRPSGTGEISSQDYSGQCMDNAGSKLASDNVIDIYTCDAGTDSQEWTVAANGSVEIGGSYCADGGVNSSGDLSAVLQPCDSNYDGEQEWIAESDGALYNTGLDSCLDAPSGTNKTQLQIDACNGTSDQSWNLP